MTGQRSTTAAFALANNAGWHSLPPMKVDGQCLCGYLSYEAEVDPDSTLICNCTDCQVLSGSAFRTSVGVIGAFRFVSGQPKTYVKVADSGTRRVLAFCPECGTSVYTAPEPGQTGFFGLRVGSLRQRDALVPRSQLWCRSAQPWVRHVDEIPVVDGEVGRYVSSVSPGEPDLEA